MAALKEDELMLEAFNMQNPVNRKLEVSNLENALRSIGKRLTNDNIEELTKQANKEFSGWLTFDDFKKYVEKASKIEKVSCKEHTTLSNKQGFTSANRTTMSIS